MLFYLKLFYGIMLLRNTPQDVPSSRALFWVTLGIYAAIGLFEGAFVFLFGKNALFNAFDIVLLLLFLHFLLSFTHRLPRFNQTATAVFGVSIILRLLELPAYMLLVSGRFESSHALFITAALYMLAIRMIGVFVNGHILKHALSTTMLVGAMWALGYFFASYMLIGIVFPR